MMHTAHKLAKWLTRRREAKATSAGPGEFLADDFKRREQFRADYETLATGLLNLLDFQTVLDIGCANGFLLTPFHRAGKSAHGVELSPHAIDFLPDSLRSLVTVADATAMGKVGDFDLVTCVEVAEHIPPERTDGLLQAIDQNASKWLYFTAATPYQPGHGHINMRPPFFYLEKFRRVGILLDYERTDALLELLLPLQSVPWLYYNSLILRRV